MLPRSSGLYVEIAGKVIWMKAEREREREREDARRTSRHKERGEKSGQHFPLKLQQASTGLHGFIAQKAIFFLDSCRL
jgi:hypothetical protein